MKEKKDCKIVQDLLPNYIEKLTNEETNKFIEEHLKECDECQKVLENMQRNLNITTTNKDKKAVKYFKKYRKKLRILRIILLIILTIFIANTARKMIIISNISSKAEKNINYENYHRVTYSYNKDNTAISEIFSLGDKKKIILTKISKEGTKVTTMYATKKGKDENENERYNTNIYTITENSKTVKKDKDMGISADPQNVFHVENFLELLIVSIPASIKTTTYNGEKCYYVSNLQSVFTFESTALYVNKETGLPISAIACEVKNSDGGITRWPAADYVYEFNTVTETDFIEPDINEYEIQ